MSIVIKDQSGVLPKHSDIEVTVINRSVIKIRDKYIIRSKGDTWIRQEAEWDDAEMDAAKHVIRELNKPQPLR